MLALRSAAGVEQALLSQQDKRLFRMLTAPHSAFRARYFFKTPTDVHGGSLAALWRRPGDGGVQSVIHFKDFRAIAVALQLVPVAGWQVLAGDLQELARGEVEQHGSAGRQLL